MSKNLLRAGYDLVVLDIDKKAVEEIAAAGAKTAESPKAVAAQVPVVITMLPNSPQVKEVVLGENGVIEAARKGLIVVDMSSIAPLVAREVAGRLARGRRRHAGVMVGGMQQYRRRDYCWRRF